MVRDTSKENLRINAETGLLGEQQTLVLKIISSSGEPLTDKEISVYNSIEINAVTGRRNELLKKGLVRDAGIRTCNITGRNAHVWTSDEPTSIQSTLTPEPCPELCKDCGRPFNETELRAKSLYCRFCKLTRKEE